MKKIICVLLIAVLLLTGCGHGKPDGLSDRAYEVGLAALETADEFLAGDLSAADAVKKLDQVCLTLRVCDGELDSALETSVALLQINIDHKDQGTATLKDVEKHRDVLAKELGE